MIFLFVYIITKRQDKYTSKKIGELTDGVMEFNTKNNIIDFRNIQKEVNSWISLDKIAHVRNLLEQEFSEDAIDYRKNITSSKILEINESLYPNLIEMILPEMVYISRISIDRDSIIKKSWETEYKLKKSSSTKRVILRAIELTVYYLFMIGMFTETSLSPFITPLFLL